jgi:SOS response regulatory protein OraA/RecX
MQESSRKNEVRSSLLKYAVNILSGRPYFRHALREKLILRAKREEFVDATEEIDNIISELAASGYLDDVYLAEAFVRRQLGKCYGPRIISLKLKQLQLDPETIKIAIFSEATKELQIEAVQKFAAKNSRKDIRIVTNKLYQRGFASDIIREISSSPFWETQVDETP